MTNGTASHPATDCLAAFALGRLGGADADGVEQHVNAAPKPIAPRDFLSYPARFAIVSITENEMIVRSRLGVDKEETLHLHRR